MREILFRGKATNRKPNMEYRTTYKNGDWVYGLITDTENYMGFAEMTNTDGISGIDVDKNTVGQYTGLTDKNGKKIFEGDIIRYSIYPPDKYEYGVVNYLNGGFRAGEDNCNLCVCSADGVASYKLEVIGNIHDNPELLKGGV